MVKLDQAVQTNEAGVRHDIARLASLVPRGTWSAGVTLAAKSPPTASGGVASGGTIVPDILPYLVLVLELKEKVETSMKTGTSISTGESGVHCLKPRPLQGICSFVCNC